MAQSTRVTSLMVKPPHTFRIAHSVPPPINGGRHSASRPPNEREPHQDHDIRFAAGKDSPGGLRVTQTENGKVHAAVEAA